ncbi:homoserine dehydrogenase [Oceanicella sp. SM1341]|uniref:homoserine dehydrogenase n=1 Tax=Oceanicella sp. SM1341 TaxID=1548889 RepID=UPI000E491829|nr:homoserine dehydrogenase [Oceanicella sp. SM1341]
MKTLNIAIAGFGGVGRTTAALLLSRRARYQRLHDTQVRLVAVCGSRAGLADPAGLEPGRLERLEAGLSGPGFITGSGADVLIEAGPSDFRTGGPGLGYLEAALAAGMDTIVISKGALVHSGPRLRDIAGRSGARIRLSGAAAAALPTLDLVRHSLAGNEVVSLEGILNATTNYLLDAMMSRGLGFEAALDEARAGGFAEADPRNDTEGWDTACKLLLIANFGLDGALEMRDIAVQGIQDVTPGMIADWTARGLSPRLVGSLSRSEGGLRGEVGIRTYPSDDPFAGVRGKAKAIRIVTEAMGETVAIGHAAEPLATAAAALKDLEHLLAAGRAAPSDAGKDPA